MQVVPAEILAAIKAAAKEEWPGDRDMQEYHIRGETKAYCLIEELDFGPALEAKDQTLAWADSYSDLWEDRAVFVQEEVEACAGLRDRPEDVPAEIFDGLVRKAADEHDWVFVPTR